MGSISLNNLQDTNSTARDYVYRDIHLGLEAENIISNNNVYKEPTHVDVKSSIDEGAIKNSIINIFNTVPGQKLLTPQFGLNISRYIFQPITHNTTTQIRREIITGIKTWEPRVHIKQLTVTPNILQHEYNITLIIIIPTLSNLDIQYNAAITQAGFTIT
jgi:phage baseplate assembly protein W